MSEAVVVFGKSATPGQVKTRMCPPLNPEQAAQLYSAFARDVLVTVTRYQRRRSEAAGEEIRQILAFDGDGDDEIARFARESGFEIVEQGEGNLGERLRRVLSELRQQGVRQMIVVGTDSPTLSPEHLSTARLHLKSQDVVFGPAFDGGYYLVGVGDKSGAGKNAEEVIFDDISWSSPRVLEESWQRARRERLLCDLMGFWYDIDTFEDLEKVRFHLFDYWASRDPLVGENTRHLLESNSFDMPKSR